MTDLVVLLIGLGRDRAWGARAGTLAHPTRGTIAVQPGASVPDYPSVEVEGDATQAGWRARVRVQLVASAAELGLSCAELARRLPGVRAELWAAWEAGAPEMIARGRLAEVQVDEARVAFTLLDPAAELRGRVLDELAVVGPATWPRTDAERAAQGDPAYSGATVGRDPEIEGQAYPVIIGAPAVDVPLEVLGGGLTSSLPCAPQLLVETSTDVLDVADHVLVIAGHPIAATTVRRVAIDTGGDRVVEDVAVLTRQDRLGRVVSVCSPALAGSIPDEGGTEAWTCLPGPAGEGLGMPSPFRPGPLRRADEVLRWLLERAGAPVDPAGADAPALAPYQIDLAIWTQVSAVQLLSELLTWLPCRLVRGPRGVRIVPTVRLRGLPVSAARWTWTHGEGAVAAGAPLSSIEAAPARVSVGYAQDARAGRSSRWVHVCPPGDPLLGLSADAVASQRLGEAQQLAGVRGEVVVREPAPTSDLATALRMAQDIAEAAGVTWTLDVRLHAQASGPGTVPRVGDLVRWRHPAQGWDVLAQVVRVEYAGGVLTAGLTWPG